MIMKLTGALILLISSGLYGMVSAGRIEEGLRQLKDLRSGFNSLKQEIVLCGTPLGMGLISSATVMTTKVRDMFTAWGRALLMGNGNAFKDEVLSLMAEPGILLCSQAKTIVAGWAVSAGSGDIKAESDSIDYTVAQLDELIINMTADCEKKARLYRNSGFLIGAFAVVLML